MAEQIERASAGHRLRVRVQHREFRAVGREHERRHERDDGEQRKRPPVAEAVDREARDQRSEESGQRVAE